MNNLEHDVDMLLEASNLLKVAREVVNILPKGKTRDNIIKQVKDIRMKLINLDVHLQDIEWTFTEYQLNKRMEQKDKNDRV